MAQDIYIQSGEFSSNLLKNTQSNLDLAHTKMSAINGCPMYQSVSGCTALFPSSLTAEISTLTSQLAAISEKMDRYSSILSRGPASLIALDRSYKGEITTWWARANYSAGGLFSNIRTASETTIGYWVDNWENKGWSYKTVQSVYAVGRALPAIAGCAVSWVTAPFLPTTILSTMYGLNAASNLGSDLGNIWTDNFDKVGNVNWLKDKLTENGGEFFETLGGSREVGELIGRCVYDFGDLITSVVNAGNFANLSKTTATSTLGNDLWQEIKSKFNFGKGSFSDLGSQAIQSDVTFKTFVDAIKEIPTAAGGLWDILANSPILEIAKDYKLLSYMIPNISEVVGATELLSDIASKTSELIKNITTVIGAL